MRLPTTRGLVSRAGRWRACIAVALAACAAPSLGACGSRLPSPDSTLQAWADAVEEGRCADAVESMDLVDAASVSAWVAACETDRDSARAEAERVRRALRDRGVSERATVPVDGVRRAELARVDGAWKLMSPPWLGVGAPSPWEGLRAWAHQLDEAMSEGAFSALAPNARRRLQNELEALRSIALRMRDEDAVVTGSTARFSRDGWSITLSRDGGGWRVESIEGAGFFQPWDW